MTVPLRASGGGVSIGTNEIEILQLTQQTMQQHDTIADLSIEWKQQDELSSRFSHDTVTNPDQITCLENGWIDVRFAVQYDQDDTARLNTEAYITVNGTRVEHTTSGRMYYRGLAYGKWGTAQTSCFLKVEVDDVIEVHSGVADGNTDFVLTRAIDTVPDKTFIQLRYMGNRPTYTPPVGASSITVTTTAYTAGEYRFILVDDDTAGSAVTVTLPLASGNTGLEYHIKKLGTTGSVIVDGAGSETIDGATTQTIGVQYDSIKIVCDGSNWFII